MEINHHKTDFIHKIGKVDIIELEKRIQTLAAADWDTDEDFNLNYNKNIANNKNQNIAALSTTQHIIFRFTHKQQKIYQYLDGSRWDLWKNDLLPVLDAATKHLNYQKKYYPKVMLAKLPPKSFIRPHTDGNQKSVTPHKIHIALSTNPEAFFFLESEKIHFQKGIAYEVNNGRTHGVINNGNTDRIHLIFECLDFEIQSPEIKNQMLNPIFNNSQTPEIF